jgi:hypothetical protein
MKSESDFIPSSTVTVDEARLELERTKANDEGDWKKREFDQKAEEIALRRAELNAQTWRNPVFAGIAVARLGLLGSITATFLQNAESERISRAKNESDLIIAAIRTDPHTGQRNLQFFIDAGFIRDPDQKITRLLANGFVPQLPPEEIAKQAQEEWFPTNGSAPDYQQALIHWKQVAESGKEGRGGSNLNRQRWVNLQSAATQAFILIGVANRIDIGIRRSHRSNLRLAGA